MKSTFRIEYDFDNAEPYIEINSWRGSNDMRDRMIRHFFEMCSGERALSFVYTGDTNSEDGSVNYETIKIFPSKSKIAKTAYDWSSKLS